MAIGLDDALLGWVVAAAGDALTRRLRGDPTRVALRKIVSDAVTATVAEVATDLDGDRVEHLHRALLERDIIPGWDQPPVRNEAELREAVHAWTTTLDEAPFCGSGYLTGVGADPQRLANALADRIVAGIYRDARGGGALNALAGWLWRDGTTAQLARIESKIDAAAGPVEPTGGGLPGGTPDFTGRQEALDALTERVQAHDPAGTVVAIHAVDGMAGVGKTELALRAAHQHKHRYPDGQYFLNLHGYTEGIPPMPPEAALEELLRQAGVPAQTIPADFASRQARWHALMSTRRALVLLDNVLDIAHVRPLLPNAAGCLVLITSRTRLSGLPGAKPLRLEVLPLDEAVELFGRLVATTRPLDRHAVATAVDMVGRLPLAVQAVAAVVGDDYTESDLARELADARTSLGLLDQTSPLDGGVRAAFETSLARLEQPHWQAFHLLGLHPGPSIGVPQFAALADLPLASARAMLRALADRNLIAGSDDQVGHHRYQMHDLVRAFARGQAAAHVSTQDRTAAIGRLTTWYSAAMSTVTRMRKATDGEPGSSPGVEGLDLVRPASGHLWMVAEQGNLLAYAEAATGAPAAKVCQQAARNLYHLCYYTTAQALYRTAAALHRQACNRSGEADARQGLGDVARLTGDYQGAVEHYAAARCMLADIGDRRGEAKAWWGLGDVARLTGDYQAATTHYQAARVAFAEVGDRRGEVTARRGLGDVARLTGDYQGATTHYQAAWNTLADIGDRRGVAMARQGLGDVARLTGDYQGATTHYQAAWSTFDEVGDRRGEAYVLRGLGDVATEQGRRDEARGHYEGALRILVEIGDPSAMSVRDKLRRITLD